MCLFFLAYLSFFWYHTSVFRRGNMKKVCAECRYLNIHDIKDGQAYCVEKCERRFANDIYADDCSRFFGIKWGYESDSKEAIKAAEKYQKEYIGPNKESVEVHLENKNGVTNAGCFITTALVNILGFDDDCEELGILRIFRKEFLQKLPEYRGILLKYDLYGPILAKALENDENSLDVAMDLYITFIKGCVTFIRKRQFERALELYMMMTNRLIGVYAPNVFTSQDMIDKYDQEKGGHGYIITKKSGC